MTEWDTYAYRWRNMDTPVEVQKRIIALGAGIWVHRYAVVQDGRVKDLFVEREDADRFMETITRNWEAKDCCRRTAEAMAGSGTKSQATKSCLLAGRNFWTGFFAAQNGSHELNVSGQPRTTCTRTRCVASTATHGSSKNGIVARLN